jgi:hypothetical protein
MRAGRSFVLPKLARLPGAQSIARQLRVPPPTTAAFD